MEASRGNGFRGDIAIDDVMCVPGKCPAGKEQLLDRMPLVHRKYT